MMRDQLNSRVAGQNAQPMQYASSQRAAAVSAGVDGYAHGDGVVQAAPPSVKALPAIHDRLLGLHSTALGVNLRLEQLLSRVRVGPPVGGSTNANDAPSNGILSDIGTLLRLCAAAQEATFVLLNELDELA